MTPPTGFLRRHGRFVLAFGFGAATFAVAGALATDVRALAAADTFFVVYLVLAARLAAELTPDRLRRRAGGADEGAPLIFVITAFAIATSVAAIFSLLNGEAHRTPWMTAAAVASVPLGWAMTHTVAAFHYAHLYYTRDPGTGSDLAGVDFPGTREPGMIEFFYLALVVGMTAQVADTNLTATAFRRAVLVHGVAAFFYNTVLIALAVNVAVNIAG